VIIASEGDVTPMTEAPYPIDIEIEERRGS
jgi:hypothetical protein